MVKCTRSKSFWSREEINLKIEAVIFNGLPSLPENSIGSKECFLNKCTLLNLEILINIQPSGRRGDFFCNHFCSDKTASSHVWWEDSLAYCLNHTNHAQGAMTYDHKTFACSDSRLAKFE